jgi:hypothetical protein
MRSARSGPWMGKPQLHHGTLYGEPGLSDMTDEAYAALSLWTEMTIVVKVQPRQILSQLYYELVYKVSSTCASSLQPIFERSSPVKSITSLLQQFNTFTHPIISRCVPPASSPSRSALLPPLSTQHLLLSLI